MALGFKSLNNKRSTETDILSYNKKEKQFAENLKGYTISPQLQPILANLKKYSDFDKFTAKNFKTILLSAAIKHPEILKYPYSIVEYPYKYNTAGLLDVKEPYLPLACFAAMHRFSPVVERAVNDEEVCCLTDAVRGANIGMFIAMFYGQDGVPEGRANLDGDIDIGNDKVFSKLMHKFISHKKAVMQQDIYGNNIGHYLAVEYPESSLLIKLATNQKLVDQVNNNGLTFIQVLKTKNSLEYYIIRRKIDEYSDNLQLTPKERTTALKNFGLLKDLEPSEDTNQPQ